MCFLGVLTLFCYFNLLKGFSFSMEDHSYPLGIHCFSQTLMFLFRFPKITYKNRFCLRLVWFLHRKALIRLTHPSISISMFFFLWLSMLFYEQHTSLTDFFICRRLICLHLSSCWLYNGGNCFAQGVLVFQGSLCLA